jgi:type IV pilus assembly protein PilW
MADLLAGLTVDLMVGLAIGMIAMLVILNVMVMFDARRRATTGSSDAQTNAVFATSVLSRELRISGHGLGPAAALSCTVHRSAMSPADARFLLVPALIVNGASGGPDQLTILAAGEQALPPAQLIAPYTINGSELTINSTLGIVPNVQLLLQSAGSSDCALLTVFSVSVGGYTVQPVMAGYVLPGVLFGADSPVVNVGRLIHRRYSVDANQQLRVESFDTNGGIWRASTLADAVVNFQVQYGFDARTGAQTTTEVTRWSDEVIDADGNGDTGNPGDWRRMLAIRIAIVTRSAQRKDEACDATSPVWLAGNPGTGELEATPIKVDHLSDWKCWRYRVLQTEVPLRNQLWNDQ